MVLSFRDMKTSSKILVLSLILNVHFLAMGAYGVSLLISNKAQLVSMEEGIVRQSERMNTFDRDTQGVLNRLYNLILTASNESDEKKLAAMVAADTDNLKKYKESFAEIARSLEAAGQEKDKIEAVTKNFESFSKSADGIIDMVESDPTTAQVWMTGAKRKFDAFITDLNASRAFLADQKQHILKNVFAGMGQGQTIFIFAMFAVTAIGIALSFVIGGKIAAPIRSMSNVIEGLAHKNYDADIPALGQKDEVGKMAEAVLVLKDSLSNADRLSAEQDKERARREERVRKMESLTADFERQVGDLVSVLSSAATELESTATEMTKNAELTAAQASDVSLRAEQTSGNVQTVASAAEELSTSVSEISRQTLNSSQVTDRAISEVRRTDTVVNDLAVSAEKIGEVVTLIESIANQTNLLALNATIEAARAGDAGKGFAVVATEVKSLANQTGNATQEISAQISQMQSATAEAVKAIRMIGERIDEVGAIQQSIASAVEEQGAATREITRNAQEASGSTRQVTDNVTIVKQAASNTGQATAEVLSAAKELSVQSEKLRASVEKYISGVRSA